MDMEIEGFARGGKLEKYKCCAYLCSLGSPIDVHISEAIEESGRSSHKVRTEYI
jgi:hypothetical protein